MKDEKYSVEIENLDFSYEKEDQVLKEINFKVGRGEFVSIIGANGSGKSTLIKLILGELKADRGKIEVLGRDIGSYKSYKEIGYVPQISIVEKIAFPITVSEMISLNLYEDMGFIKIPRQENKEKIDEAIAYMGLESYKNKPINELSGGLKQRTMIARAMVNRPKLLILDEPTSGVDEKNKREFFKSIEKLNTDGKLTIILVTHEIDELTSYISIDKIYEIHHGRLVGREVI